MQSARESLPLIAYQSEWQDGETKFKKKNKQIV